MKKLSSIIVLWSLALTFIVTVGLCRTPLLFAGGPEKGYTSVYKNLTEKAVNRGRCTAFNKIGQNLLASGSEVPVLISLEIAEACGALGVDVNPGLVELSYCLTTSQINTPPFVQGVEDPENYGTSENPYRICNLDQFDYIVNDDTIWDEHFVLEADIDLTGYTDENGNANPVIGNVAPWFKGSIAGNGHTLSNFSVNDTSAPYLGLIGQNRGRIANLTLTYVNLTGDNYVGAIAGINSGTIIDSYAEGSVAGQYYIGGITGKNRGSVVNTEADVDVSGTNYIGGLVGDSYSGIISNSNTIGAVSGVGSIGGLAGMHRQNANISDSYAVGDVTAVTYYVGGLVGLAGGTITNSYALGNVSGGNVSGYKGVGGLVGWLGGAGVISNSHAEGIVTGYQSVGGLVGGFWGSGPITDSYATGNVVGTGGNAVGGLVGGSNNGPISYSYATGNVTSSGGMVGGLVGNDGTTYVEHCYATGDVSGYSGVGGLVGSGGSSDISWSYATGNVNSVAVNVGGLSGSSANISFSYATGDVNNATDYLSGGLTGSAGTITDSYATGNVNGVHGVGGLAGRATTVTRSYATGIVTAASTVGAAGFVAGYVSDPCDPGPCPDHTASFWVRDINHNVGLSDDRFGNDYPGVFAETTANMQMPTPNIFTNQGWDFTTVWTMPSGVGYPILNPPASP